MNQEESVMNESQSMQLIAAMINKAKNRFNETGTLYLLWGWLILACCIIQFAGNYFFNWHYAFTIWYTTWGAVIYQIFYLKKKKRKEGVSTYTDDIIKYVWLALFICAAILILMLIKFQYYLAIYPTILIIYGLPTFLSGVIIKFKPLQLGGIICWALSIICVFVLFKYQLLLIALAVILAWIIPGYLLKAKFKKEN